MVVKPQIQSVLGALLGLLLPPLGLWLILTLRPEIASMQRFDHELVKQLNLQLITLGMLFNAAFFFIFLRWHKESAGNGILVASVLWLLAIFIYKFLL